MSKVAIPEIPLELPQEVREILEPMKQMIEQLVRAVDPDKLPTTRPDVPGVVWSDNGRIKVS